MKTSFRKALCLIAVICLTVAVTEIHGEFDGFRGYSHKLGFAQI